MDWEHYTLEDMHPCILYAKAQDANTPDWEMVMNGPDHDGYWEPAKNEISTWRRSTHGMSWITSPG